MQCIPCRELPVEEVEKIADKENCYFHENRVSWFELQGEKRIFKDKVQLFRLEPEEDFEYAAMEATIEPREGYIITHHARDRKAQVDLYIVRPIGFTVGELAHGS